jgi:DNA-binding IscR family transcriptional regulator
MKGNEKQIIKIIAELEEACTETIARKVGVSTEYTAAICQGLAKDGYLLEGSNGNYRLAPQALKAIDPVRIRGPIRVLKGGR